MLQRPSFRTLIAPFLPILALGLSGCIYAVKPSTTPENKPVASSLPLRVAVSSNDKPNKWDSRPVKSSVDAFVTALLHTGLFRDVRAAAPGTPGFDLSVQLTSKLDRTMHHFFPFFLPLCDPLIIGCLPFYTLSEDFTTDMKAEVIGQKSYSEKGLAILTCQGTFGCVPASEGDPLARTASVDDAANKIAADFLKDTAFFRTLAQATAARTAELESRMEGRESAPSQDPAEPAASGAAAPAQKEWWKQ